MEKTINSMIWQKETTVSSAFTDNSSRLGLAQTSYLLQDGFTECLGDMGFDGITVRNKFNACWVVTKSKIFFNRRPDWNERILITSYPNGNSGVRTHVATEISDMTGQPLVQALQELCIIDLSTHKLMRLSKIGFPKEGFPEEPTLDWPDFRDEEMGVPESMSGSGEMGYQQKIFSQHIDMSNHVNNVEYIKLSLNLFPTETFKTRDIVCMESAFLSECPEGSILTMTRRDRGLESFCTVTHDSCQVFQMKIQFRPDETPGFANNCTNPEEPMI